MSLADYFSKNRSQPKFLIGDKVHGKFRGVPFMGTVGNDRIVNEETGSMVSVHLYLPMKIDNGFVNVINVSQSSLKVTK